MQRSSSSRHIQKLIKAQCMAGTHCKQCSQSSLAQRAPSAMLCPLRACSAHAAAEARAQQQAQQQARAQQRHSSFVWVLWRLAMVTFSHAEAVCKVFEHGKMQKHQAKRRPEMAASGAATAFASASCFSRRAIRLVKLISAGLGRAAAALAAHTVPTHARMDRLLASKASCECAAWLILSTRARTRRRRKSWLAR